MKICQSCQHENEEAALFCENCGDKIKTQPITQAENDDTFELKTPEVAGNNTCSCGTVLEEEDQFCTTCGESVSKDPTYHLEDAQVSKVKQPMKQKQKILITLSVALMCLVFGTYFAAKNYYSQENQLKRMVEIVKNKDVNKMEKLTVSVDPNYNVTRKEIKKYFDYYGRNEHKEAFSRLIEQLGNVDNHTGVLSLIKNGKKFLLFDHYQWALKPGYITIKANQKDMKLFLNNQEKETTDKAQFQTVWGPLTPAEYTVKGELAGEKSETTIDLLQRQNSGDNQTNQVNLDFRKISFKLTSNISEADVFINDKKIGQLLAGEYEVKNLIWHQEMTVQLKQALEDKSVIETKPYIINDSSFDASEYDPESYSSIIKLDFAGIQGESNIEWFLNSFYSTVSGYTSTYSTYDETTKQKFSNHFIDGKDNAEYQDFNTFIQSVRDSKVKRSVTGSPTVESVKMTGKNSYDVQYLIKYKTNYKEYKQPDVTQLFRYKKATLIYNEEEKQFAIKSLGGKENFEVVDNGGID